MKSNKTTSNIDSVECIPFKSWTFATFTSTNNAAPTVVTVLVNPTIDARLTQIADNFTWYRFTKIKVSGYPSRLQTTDTSSTVEWLSMGYLPRTPDTAPTTHGEIQAFAPSKFMTGVQTTPVHMGLGRAILLGDAPIKWFQTVAGTQATQFEIQGNLYFAGSGFSSHLWPLTIEGVCEFKGRTTSVTNPLKILPIPFKEEVPDSTKWSDKVDLSKEEKPETEVVIGKYVYKIKDNKQS